MALSARARRKGRGVQPRTRHTTGWRGGTAPYFFTGEQGEHLK